MIGVLVRIEALKTAKRLGFWVTTGLFAAFNAMFAFSSLRSDITRESYTFALPEAWSTIIEPGANIGPFFLGVVMILLVAPEFSWRTARQNVIDGLSKERFFAGKVILFLPLTVVYAAIPVVIGGTVALLSPSETGSPLVGPSDFNFMIASWLGHLLVGSGAFLLAALLRTSGAAMGILFVYLLVEQIFADLIGRSSEILSAVTDFLPINTQEVLVSPPLHYPRVLAEQNALRAEQGRPLLEFHDFWLLVVVALAYCAVFLAIAFLSLRRRDL